MPLNPTQSQYAEPSDLALYSLTPAQAGRFVAESQLAAVKAASALADAYIGGQFLLPLALWDLSLVVAVCNMAAYWLFNQYCYNPNAPADKQVLTRYQQSIDWLVEVRDKKVSPSWTDSSASGQPAG